MPLPQALRWLKHQLNHFIEHIENRLRQLTRPSGSRNPATGALTDLSRSKRDLIAENALLRQQLIVLKRQIERPRLTHKDRWLMVLLARLTVGWKQALFIVQPDTLLKWHRQGFRLFWGHKSGHNQAHPQTPLPEETIDLIKEMAINNRLWGAERIHGELLKLGLHASKRTIQKYMSQARRDLPPKASSQTWSTFLTNHASEIWACDILQTYDLLFRSIFIFFIIELRSRRIVHFGVTRSPTDTWLAQQLRNATPFAEGPRFLIRDNDHKFGSHFQQVALGTDIKVLPTPIAAPRANAFCERFLRSVRHECLDHVLILSERHLRKTLAEYLDYFNHARPHQGIAQQIPESDPGTGSLSLHATVTSRSVLAGLHHDYRRAA
ncbi:MAG: integrase core domain-containing protein [Anaerolineae bacterium]|nr:integrase core domain-containing protein [Anaerolineae bacterium]